MNKKFLILGILQLLSPVPVLSNGVPISEKLVSSTFSETVPEDRNNAVESAPFWTRNVDREVYAEPLGAMVCNLNRATRFCRRK